MVVTRISAAVATAALAALVGSASAQEVRVMSFNIRTSYAGEDARSTCSNWYGVRKDNVVAQIKTVAPDFVGTQETAEEQKAFLDAQLAGLYGSVGRYSGSLNNRAGEVNSIHYKLADWKSIGDGMIWLGPNTEAPSAAWGGEYYRTAVYARFQHLQTGQTVCMFNTHYETPGKTEAQTQSSGIILARMATVCQPGDKLQVITGDFNAQPGEQAIAKLMAGGFAEPSTAGTYCGNMISPGCSSKFDFTFFKLAGGACHKASDVLRTAFGGCYTSDHAPLLGTFCLGGSCSCGETPTSTPEPTPEPTTVAPTPSVSEVATQGSGSGGAGGVDAGVYKSAVSEENVVPGTVSAPVESGAIGGATGGNNAAGTAAADSDATSAGSGTAGSGNDATRVSTSKSTGAVGAGGTVFAVLGVVGAVAAVAGVVVRKKRALDARLDGEKSFSAPVPSYFTRGADSDDLSPLPRITERSEFERQTNSPIPTLGAAGVGNASERDSRSSSVSWKGGASPPARESSTAFSMASPSVLGGDSMYARSTYDAGMQESRINFSEADLGESYESDEGGALTAKSSRTDFAML